MSRKKAIRRRFRDSVYLRDKHTCQVCGTKREEDQLNAHHITDRSLMPKGGYIKENGITLCEEICHLLCEEFHISGGKSWNDGLHPDDLYLKIDSSYEEAVAASKKL